MLQCWVVFRVACPRLATSTSCTNLPEYSNRIGACAYTCVCTTSFLLQYLSSFHHLIFYQITTEILAPPLVFSIHLVIIFFVSLVISAKLDGVKTYMRMRRVPNHLQVKVIKWFDYLWLTQKCSDEEKAVSCLPGKKNQILFVLKPSVFLPSRM